MGFTLLFFVHMRFSAIYCLVPEGCKLLKINILFGQCSEKS